MKKSFTTISVIASLSVIVILSGLKFKPSIKSIFETPNIEVGDFSYYGVTESSPVVIYTVEWCGYCTKLRKFLDDKEVPYTEYDIEKNPKAKQEFDKLEAKGTPLVIIKDTLIRGYALPEIEAKLQTLGLGQN